jgi:hypothetical protein
MAMVAGIGDGRRDQRWPPEAMVAGISRLHLDQ